MVQLFVEILKDEFDKEKRQHFVVEDGEGLLFSRHNEKYYKMRRVRKKHFVDEKKYYELLNSRDNELLLKYTKHREKYDRESDKYREMEPMVIINKIRKFKNRIAGFFEERRRKKIIEQTRIQLISDGLDECVVNALLHYDIDIDTIEKQVEYARYVDSFVKRFIEIKEPLLEFLVNGRKGRKEFARVFDKALDVYSTKEKLYSLTIKHTI